MDVDVDCQLSAVRGENPTWFYSHSHSILDEDIILFLQAQSRSGCALEKYRPRQLLLFKAKHAIALNILPQQLGLSKNHTTNDIRAQRKKFMICYRVYQQKESRS